MRIRTVIIITMLVLTVGIGFTACKPQEAPQRANVAQAAVSAVLHGAVYALAPADFSSALSTPGTALWYPEETVSYADAADTAQVGNFPETKDVAAGVNPNDTTHFEADALAVLVDEMLSRMTTEEKIGQLMICRLPGGKVYALNDATAALINNYHVGGFILFSENIESIAQTQALTAALQETTKIPLFIATDEEGGRVTRIGKLYTPAIASAYTVGQDENTAAAYHMGLTIGNRLAALGINMDFAPVADIWSNQENTVIGDRAFGTTPEVVAGRVSEAVRGLQEAGILSVLKHFPGHGDTAEDTHQQIAIYRYDKARFDTFEALPFQQGILAGADGVMMGHIATPEIQNPHLLPDWLEPWRISGRLPAVFSAYWMQDVLREEMAFDGLIITDALEMKALTASFTPAQIVVGAVAGGADILLIPADPAVAAEALMAALQTGQLSEARLDASVRRILRAKINAHIIERER